MSTWVWDFLRKLGSSWRNTGEMPFVMRVLCQGAMVVTPLFILAVAMPLADWEIDGRTMTYRELWISGNGPMIAVCLALYCFGAWGLAARHHSSRWVLVFAGVAPAVFIGIIDRSIPWTVLIDAAISGLALYFCLFRLRAVQSYMDGTDKRVARHGA